MKFNNKFELKSSTVKLNFSNNKDYIMDLLKKKNFKDTFPSSTEYCDKYIFIYTNTRTFMVHDDCHLYNFRDYQEITIDNLKNILNGNFVKKQ